MSRGRGGGRGQFGELQVIGGKDKKNREKA